MSSHKSDNIHTSDTRDITPNLEHEKLLEVLKFTPRTYKIRAWGYGGEYVLGKVSRKIYDYFKSRGLDFSEFCHNSDYADENDIPADMCPFDPGCWYDCDDYIHVNGVAIDAGTLEIEDEAGEVVYTADLSTIDDDGVMFQADNEVYVHSYLDADTAVFCGISSEKGTFFEGEIDLKAPFDKENLTILLEDVDGNVIMGGIRYNDEEIECLDMSTSGKSYDMYMYAQKADGTTESYTDSDSIDSDTV